MSEEKIRAFIAIELPGQVQAELGAVQEMLKSQIASKVKWVQPHNIHLTLRFLGNITSQQEDEIKKMITNLAKETGEFELTLAGIGAFPKIEYPRVIWIGINEGKDIVIQLSQRLDERLSHLGIPSEGRPFQPHLTLGRVKFLKEKSEFIHSIGSAGFVSQNKVAVRSITLMKSTLTPKGPIYTPLYQAPLQKGQP